MEAAFDHVTSSAGDRKFVWSREAFCGASFVTAERVHWIAERLSAYDVTIVVVLRQQRDWVSSAYLEWGVSAGMDLVPLSSIGAENYIPDYYNTLSAWADAFGDSVIRIIPLTPEFTPNGLIRAFLEAAEFPTLDDPVIPPRKNERVPWELMKLVARYNQVRHSKTRPQLLMNRFAELNERCQQVPDLFHYFEVSEAARKTIDRAVSDINRAIEDRFFPEREAPIFESASDSSAGAEGCDENADPLELEFDEFLPVYVFLLQEEERRQQEMLQRIEALEAEIGQLKSSKP